MPVYTKKKKTILPKAKELNANVGYGFLIVQLLKLKGIRMSIGNEVHMNTHLFQTKPKENKGEASTSIIVQVISFSSSAPLTKLIAQAKRKRVAPKKISHL